MIATGTVVADRYEVEELLGAGGLAEVYRVRHVALGSVHALKVLTWDRASLDRRLLLEGRIQAQLQHPNVVSVNDVLSVHGRAALLMEYVDGPTLKEWLAEHGPPSIDEGLDLFAPVLAAVVRAHDAGVLHRDLKPHNVLLQRTRTGWIPKVADFGLAKVMIEEMAASATRTNVAMGTPGYMAPEQVRDASRADARTDVFALGAVLQELLTGDEAFADDQGNVEVTATLEHEPRPMQGVPDAVATVITRALSKDPAHRYDDARAMADALYPVGHPQRDEVLAASVGAIDLDERRLTPGPTTWQGTPAPAPRAQVAPRAGASTTPPPLPTVVPEPPSEVPRSRRPLALLALGFGVLLLAAAPMTWWAVSSPETSRVPAAPDPLQRPPPLPSPVPVSPRPTPPPTAPAPPPSPDAGTTAPGEASEEAERQAAIERMTRMLVGTWKGQAQGKPIQVRIIAATPERVTAELVFNPGAAQSVLPLDGSYRDGALTLSEGNLRLDATLSDGTLSGSYQRGPRAIPFTAGR